MKGPQKISCFRCIYLLVVYLLGKGVSWIGVTSKHWQRYKGRRSLMLLNKNQAHLRWTWNLTAKEKNKIIHGGTSDFWIHVKNPKFKNQAIRVLWGKTLFLTWTNSEWSKLVSETIFFINRDIFVLKVVLDFCFGHRKCRNRTKTKI